MSNGSSSAAKPCAPKPDGQKRKRGDSYFQGHFKKSKGNKNKTDSSRENQSGT